MFNAWNAIEYLRSKNSKYIVLSLNTLLVIFLGIIDFYTGHKLIFAIFYLFFISITVLLSTAGYGIFISCLAAVTGLLVDISFNLSNTDLLYPILNNFFRLTYYLAHTILLSRFIINYQRIKELALIDPLTNINNSRAFQIKFQHEIDKSRRTKQPIALVYFDIDNFKAVNDTHGHSIGDVLLKSVTGVILDTIRPMDIMARLGGDEFALLLPETDVHDTKTVVERIQSAIRKLADENNWPITLSLGCIVFSESSLSRDDMIKLVDGLMYEVKKEGKNSAKFKTYPD